MKLLFSVLATIIMSLSAMTAHAGTDNHDQHHAHDKAIMITDVIIRQTTPQAGATAAYAIIHNHGSHDDRLVSASVSFAKKAEIHEMKLEGDVMKMRELTGGLIIPAGSSVALKSGAEHIMLMGLTEPIRKDSLYEIAFQFEIAGTIKTSASTISLSGSQSGAKSHSHKH